MKEKVFELKNAALNEMKDLTKEADILNCKAKY